MKKYLVLLILLVSLSSCEEFLNPKISQNNTEDKLITQPDQVRGLVYFAYRCIPNTNDYFEEDFLESATDNAVSNNRSGSIARLAEQKGYLSAAVNPLNSWGNRYEEIMSINKFFRIMSENDITFVKSSERGDTLVQQITRGEAYFLRAYAHADLLRRFAGLAIDPADGTEKMMGVVIADKDMTPNEFKELPRKSYKETLDFIIQDLDSAISYLPEDWWKSDANKSDLYLGYANNIGRPSDIVCNALKSRVYLYAASPAFSVGLSAAEIDTLYTLSAEASALVFDAIGFDYVDYIYYPDAPDPSESFFNAPQNSEMLMRKISGNLGIEHIDRGLETRHLIPSLYGGGRCNPSQDLVDAFPMKNGYPIDHASSGYDENNPYADRDPRLYMTVLHNGVNIAFNNTSVEVFDGGKDLNGGDLAKVTNSTRTGYYLRKWLSPNVILAPGQEKGMAHISSVFRQVEVLLNFAEAVYYLNDKNHNATFDCKSTTGPKSAMDAITAIANRANYSLVGCPYYLSITNDGFEKFMKNERRIELCFEGGHRFFDLRRWNDPLAVKVEGIKFADATDTKGEIFTVVEKLAFDDANPYLPLPQRDINIMPNLTQNKGW